MKPLEELVRPNIRALKPTHGPRRIRGGEITTWLDANENPYDNGVNRYLTRIRSSSNRRSPR